MILNLGNRLFSKKNKIHITSLFHIVQYLKRFDNDLSANIKHNIIIIVNYT